MSKHSVEFTAGDGAVEGHEPGTLYFGYGSNLSSTQMCARCPNSEAVGLAFLPEYQFIINERGFANVVPARKSAAGISPRTGENNEAPSLQQREDGRETAAPRHRDEQGVYGVLYALGDEDEDLLDVYEGVSTGCYAKELLSVDVRTSTGKWQAVPALVYIDSLRVSEDVPRREYIARMNRGVDEAKRDWGLPQEYVDDVMRRFIPAAPAT